MIRQLSIVSLLALLPACPLLSVSAEVQEVCLTYPDFEVDGTLIVGSVRQTIEFDDLDAIHDITDLDAGIEFTRAELRVKQGVDDLSFVHELSASVSSGDPSSSLPPLELFNCDGDCIAEGDKLEVPASTATDAIDYVKTDSILLDLEFSGAIPQAKFKVDVDICLKGKLAYRLDP